MSNPADVIFHEQQVGALCAQHCLNALLQGSYFSAVDLAEIAQQLDAYELDVMAEGDVSSKNYRKFAQGKSMNMDDSGFFSIQVITQALQVWNLECIPLMSEEMKPVRANPLSEKAFICNLHEHWITIRRFGQHWANLNSTLKRPQFISNTYLGLLLMQMQQEGYSVFVIRGQLPRSAADELLGNLPASAVTFGDTDAERASSASAPAPAPAPVAKTSSGNIHTLSSLSSKQQSDPARALSKSSSSASSQSLSRTASGTSGIDSLAPNAELLKKMDTLVPESVVTRPVDIDEVRSKRLQRFASGTPSSQ